MEQYHDLAERDKYIISEYLSWSKSECDIKYKLEMLEYYYSRALSNNIHTILLDIMKRRDK